MSKKDFQLIADVLCDLPQGTTRDTFTYKHDRILATRFADALATTNDRFDRLRFLRACGVEETPRLARDV